MNTLDQSPRIAAIKTLLGFLEVGARWYRSLVDLLIRPRAWFDGAFILGASWMVSSTAAVEITDGTYEGRPQFVIRSENATWFYDKAGGGFSRLIDRDGRDWIAFSKNPLREYPASAAAGYRGIPNLIFGAGNPDAGAGHPGFDQCESVLVSTNRIRTASRSGKWAWQWVFSETKATMTMEKADPDHAWWFLYEGPIAGTFSPAEKYWGTNLGGPRFDVPDNRRQLFENWKWVYFGDLAVPRVLFVSRHEEDELPDTYWYLGSGDGGAPSAPDGMLVFGFGRGPGTKPRFRGAGQEFTVGLIELERLKRGEIRARPNRDTHGQIAARIDSFQTVESE